MNLRKRYVTLRFVIDGDGRRVAVMKVENKVVVRFRDGNLMKGYTHDFFPNKEVFHLTTIQGGGDPQEVHLSELKAVFFVKTFEGSKDHRKSDDPVVMDNLKKTPGFKLKIRFLDGEEMYVLTQGYDPARKGFFVYSKDPDSNWERAYVVKQATKEVTKFR